MEIVKSSVSLINPFKDFMTDREYFLKQLKHIEKIARICYKSEEKITDVSYFNFIKMLVKKGHLAMIEHSSLSFLFITDRGISHEIVRHRLSSFAQESTRYCNYSNDKFDSQIKVIFPNKERLLKNREIWEEAILASEKAYLDLIESGVSPQIARSVLPNALKTEIVMTANFREWLHFIELRTSKEAHPQIRELANQILEMFKEYAPCLIK